MQKFIPIMMLETIQMIPEIIQDFQMKEIQMEMETAQEYHLEKNM